MNFTILYTLVFHIDINSLFDVQMSLYNLITSSLKFLEK
jgi:hypothetical protein